MAKTEQQTGPNSKRRMTETNNQQLKQAMQECHCDHWKGGERGGAEKEEATMKINTERRSIMGKCCEKRSGHVW